MIKPVKTVLLGVIMLFLTACVSDFQDKKNILIISVDKFAFSNFVCLKETRHPNSAFDQLCKESVRFTHAYTTSTYTSGAMASLLTGTYPWQNSVVYNSDFLSSTFETIAEAGSKNGYNTALITGGLPIFRLNNLHQGFHFFEDNYHPTVEKPFREASSSVEILKDWIADGSIYKVGDQYVKK